ncbi:MAG TPA: TonB-dependent receptor [Bryobacteraceae bacterium]|nr:TonB-dependent receptor [Bryobacteraceae bacterium]
MSVSPCEIDSRRTAWTIAVSLLLLAGLIKGDQASQGSEDQLKGLSLEQLGNIEVTTVSKEPVKVSRTPAAIYVITQEDIRRSGATSLPEVLRLAPGVEVARIDAVKWSIGVRGFGSRLSRDVLVVIDGRTVYDPLYAGVYWEVQDTLMQDVERIEIIRGPGGTIWGPNAVNGVINIITKNSRDTHGGLVSAGGGNEQRFLNFRYGAGNGTNFDYRVYGKAFTRGPEFHPDRRNFDDWQMGQGGFRMDWDLKNLDKVTLQGDFYDGAIGESISVAAKPTVRPVIVQQDGRVSGGNLLGRWRHVLKDGSDLQVQTYYDRTSRHEANFVEIRDTFDIDALHHKTLKRRHELLWGAGARFSVGSVPPVVPTIIFTPDKRTDKQFSAFVQDDIQLLGEEKGLWLTIGSKFLRTDYSGFDVEPSVRLLWTPTLHQTWWTAVTRAIRTPSDVEETLIASGLVSANPLTIARIEPNTRFVPETMLGYEAGFRRLLGSRLYVDITAFHNHYNNLESVERALPLLQTSPPPQQFVIPLFLGNGLYGSTSGFEIAPDWRPVTWWRLDGSYAYLYMNLRTRPGSVDVFTPQSTEGSSPHHQLVIQSSLELPGNLEFSQAYRYVSDLPTQLVTSYGTADVRLSWRRIPHFEFSLVGQNLLQPHHAEYGGDPITLVGIKRNVYGAITWRQ